MFAPDPPGDLYARTHGVVQARGIVFVYEGHRSLTTPIDSDELITLVAEDVDQSVSDSENVDRRI
ncbi:MAG: hypothetical protein R2735_13835 [Microthrixaceae bacterium]